MQGKKTIATAVVSIIAAIAAMYFDIDLTTEQQSGAIVIVISLLGIFLRDGVKTEAAKARGDVR